MRPHPRRWCQAVLLAAACTLLSSCCTMIVWGFELRTEDADTSWQWCRETYDEQDMAWWQRVLLTPLTLLVDCATWPLQYWLFEDDDDCHRHHR